MRPGSAVVRFGSKIPRAHDGGALSSKWPILEHGTRGDEAEIFDSADTFCPGTCRSDGGGPIFTKGNPIVRVLIRRRSMRRGRTPPAKARRLATRNFLLSPRSARLHRLHPRGSDNASNGARAADELSSRCPQGDHCATNKTTSKLIAAYRRYFAPMQYFEIPLFCTHDFCGCELRIARLGRPPTATGADGAVITPRSWRRLWGRGARATAGLR